MKHKDKTIISMAKTTSIFFFLLLSLPAFSQHTFTNPLLPSGADPWSIHKDGYYYYTNTLGDRIDIWKTKNLADLKTAERKTIWTPPSGTVYSKEIWAPEIHFIQGKWFVYFAADDGKNDNHRLYVLENTSADPLTGEWIFKGKISDSNDKWAIDGSVFTHKDQLYMVWSGWEGDVKKELCPGANTLFSGDCLKTGSSDFFQDEGNSKSDVASAVSMPSEYSSAQHALAE